MKVDQIYTHYLSTQGNIKQDPNLTRKTQTLFRLEDSSAQFPPVLPQTMGPTSARCSIPPLQPYLRAGLSQLFLLFRLPRGCVAAALFPSVLDCHLSCLAQIRYPGETSAGKEEASHRSSASCLCGPSLASCEGMGLLQMLPDVPVALARSVLLVDPAMKKESKRRNHDCVVFRPNSYSSERF